MDRRYSTMVSSFIARSSKRHSSDRRRTEV
jgi:hypothetical protein